jgi:hypothetical protein
VRARIDVATLGPRFRGATGKRRWYHLSGSHHWGGNHAGFADRADRRFLSGHGFADGRRYVSTGGHLRDTVGFEPAAGGVDSQEVRARPALGCRRIRQARQISSGSLRAQLTVRRSTAPTAPATGGTERQGGGCARRGVWLGSEHANTVPESAVTCERGRHRIPRRIARPTVSPRRGCAPGEAGSAAPLAAPRPPNEKRRPTPAS